MRGRDPSRAPRWRRYLRFFGPDVAADVEDELRFHLEMRERDLVAQGMDPDAARARAREMLGDLEQIHQQCTRIGERRDRMERFGEALGSLRRDVAYALRALSRTPVFALSVILMLALGIGANSTLFALCDAVLLHPLPGIRDAGALVDLSSQSMSYPAYRDFRDGTPPLADLAAFSQRTVALGDGARSALGMGVVVSGNYFRMLAARAARGRLLEPADDDPAAPSAAVVSDAFWRRFLAADPGAVGRTLLFDGKPVTIVGITEPGFHGTRIGTPDAWIPIHVWPRVAPLAFGTVEPEMRNWGWLHLVGRLAPGATLAEVHAALVASAAAQHAVHPDTRRMEPDLLRPVSSAAVATGFEGRDDIVRFFALLAAMVAVVLLIACANVANLLLARANRRRREIAVRLALGASRRRLIRQLLTESLVLALAACAAGVGAMLLVTAALDGASLPGYFVARLELHPDWRVLAFTLGVTLATGIAFGLFPALQATRVDLVPDLRGAATNHAERSRLRGALVAGQVALTVVLLVGAGLFARGLARALAIDPGFRTAGIAMARVDPGLARYDVPRSAVYYDEVLRRVRALPGVAAASWTTAVPLTEEENVDTPQIEGYEPRPNEDMFIETTLVGDDFFGTLGIPLLRGRGIDRRDLAGAPAVAVVNATLAGRYFAGRDALGGRVRVGERTVTIVGITRDIKYHALREDPRPYLYLALQQQLDTHPFLTAMALLVRTDSSPQALLPSIEHELRAVAPNVPIYQAGTFDDVLAGVLMPQRFGAVLLGLFAALAILIAAVGIFGAVSYGVSQRTREIGIRMALGASSDGVVRLVLARSLLHVTCGVALGLSLAAACAGLARSFLYGLPPIDLPTYAATSALLLLVALVAAYLPARSATRIDPALTLRVE